MGVNRRTWLIALGMASALPLAACGRGAPTGQVVARVNGEEITDRDLNAEFATASLAGGTDLKAISPAVLAKVIDRRLVAAQARQVGLDKSPDYMALLDRAGEVLLAEQMAARWAGEAPAPSADQIAAFAAANPRMFAERRLVALDRLVAPGANVDLRSLASFHSLDAIAQWLGGRGIKFNRDASVADTAQMPKEAVDALAGVPAGEPVLQPNGRGFIAVAVTQSRPVAMSDAERRAAAVQALQRQAVAERIAGLRTGSKIEYQPGFAPSANGAKPPAR